MKNLLILMLVLGLASVANAQTGTIRVDPQDAADSYYPSDIITIEIVADYGVGTLTIDDITTDTGGTASAPALGTEIAAGYVVQPGTLVNAGGILVSDIAGDGGGAMGTVPAGNTVWTFEYHVPDVEEPSTYITIGVNNINMTDQYYGNWVTDVGSVVIHVVPEPMTIALLGLGGLFLRRRR